MTLLALRHRPITAIAGIVLLAACNASGGGGTTPSASASGTASASASASESAASAINVATTSVGASLTGAGGKTLYVFTKDSAGKSACNGDCAATWPPLTVEGAEKASAGDGVNAAWLGTLTRDDGKTQVSYNGRPLYYYGGDTKAGDTNGQGKGGVWFVATPDGTLPSASSSAPAGASASASSTY
jgi:predicted lipoprotein with Yx(FWY)xxD motif